MSKVRKYKKIYIEITNHCNFACSFCPPTERKLTYMSIESFKRVLGEVEPYGKFIYLHVKGEPLMHPELPEILSLCEKKGFIVNITTNGMGIKKYGELLLGNNALRQLNLSLHAYAEKNVGIQDQYLEELSCFLKRVMAENNLLVSLRFWNYTKDQGFSLQEEFNLRVFKKLESLFGLDYSIDDLLKHGAGVKIAEKIYVNSDRVFKWPSLKDDYDESRGFCHGLRNQIAILVDGTVVPCCLDGEGEMSLGNIFKESLTEILSKDRVRKIYEGFTARKAVEELCRKCTFKEKF